MRTEGPGLIVAAVERDPSLAIRASRELSRTPLALPHLPPVLLFAAGWAGGQLVLGHAALESDILSA